MTGRSSTGKARAGGWRRSTREVAPEARGRKMPEARGHKMPEARGHKMPEARGHEMPAARGKRNPETHGRMIPPAQAEVVALLLHLAGAEPIETHISAVFVGPDTVWKLKKAVALG